MKMEATYSSETSFFTRPTGSHTPEDGIIHALKVFTNISFAFRLLPKVQTCM
jgi:hypothetical protein